MDNLLEIYKKLGTTKTAIILGAVAMVLSFLIYFVSVSRAPEMGILYTDLDAADASRIIDRLKNSKIPMEVKHNGMQILVPREKIPELRMEFAADGMITGGVVGYEMFDKADLLGTSSSLLDINHLRAIEGELTKSIQSIQSVQSARVHLVVPKRELFSKNQAMPSASIVLKMRGNQRLSANQIQAVQALVSTAVLNMTNDRISIIDDKGTLLSRGRDASTLGDNVSIFTAMKEEYEEKTARQLEQLLEKTLGPDQVRVEMTVDMDFDKVTSQSVDYDPDGQVLKSISTSEEGSNSTEGNRDAVTIQNAIPNQENGAAGANGPSTTTSKSEETRTFEISNKTTTIVKEVGAIKRLSVAVLVNGSYEKDAEGIIQYTPRSEIEINQITDLIKTAVGFQEDREDSIKVVNLRFNSQPEEIKSLVEPVFWEYYIKSVDKRKAIELAIIGLFGLLIILGFIKPFVMRMIQLSQPIPVAAATQDSTNDGLPLDTRVSDELSLLDRIEQQELMDKDKKRESEKRLNQLIKRDTEKSLSVLRSWLNEGESGI